MIIKKLFIIYFIFQCFFTLCNGHTLNIEMKTKTFEIETLYNNDTRMINQNYIIYCINSNTLYEKYIVGKTNIYGSLFFESIQNINNYNLNIISGEHSIDKIFELKSPINNNEISKITYKNIIYGLNWIIGIFGFLFYISSKKILKNKSNFK